MNIEDYIKYCTEKPGVRVDYPFDGSSAWIKVVEKVFALTNIEEMKIKGELVPPFYLINLKCDPERAIELREQYDSIIPAWHMSKKHWNSVLLDGGVDDRLILELTDHSYDLVFQTLTKKTKDELNS